MKFVSDTWLSEVFGYDVFKINLENNETLDAKNIFPKELPKRAFYYAKVPVTAVSQVGNLTNAGFRVIDVNVTFERQPEVITSNEKIIVRDVKPEDEIDVLKIAESSFVYSRFHLDPFVSKELADKIKREWIANYVRKQRGERLLVAEINGKPAGFLAELVTNEKIGVIDLIGVDKNMQGQGIGKRLVQFHIKDAMKKYNSLLVGTQIANIPSMRLYQTCGYEISHSSYVLHAHVNEGKLI
ncbi:MAG: GNAT family N-acetyltransferase [Anaerolineales bacterium]|nr:GNAT family N-acetyltransferase [Anaerolineales bacterium]